MQGHGGVEARLSAECWKKGIRAFFFDDGCAYFGCDGFDISLVSHFGVGHDRGGIAVDQHDFVSLFFEGFAGLCARVVKFTGLSNDDGTRADEHYFFEVGSFGHKELSVVSGRARGHRPYMNGRVFYWQGKHRLTKAPPLPEWSCPIVGDGSRAVPHANHVRCKSKQSVLLLIWFIAAAKFSMMSPAMRLICPVFCAAISAARPWR